MTASSLHIITRESPLAMWQALHVCERLQRIHPALDVRVIGVSTEADRFLDSTLASLGGKGASGRNAEYGERIEEHGLHIWFGFYDNAFKTIQAAYERGARLMSVCSGSAKRAPRPGNSTGCTVSHCGTLRRQRL